MKRVKKTTKFRTYRTSEMDPDIAAILDMRSRSGMKKAEVAKAAQDSVVKGVGVTSSTLSRWEKKRTRFPRNSTVESAGRGMGMKRVWVKA